VTATTQPTTATIKIKQEKGERRKEKKQIEILLSLFSVYVSSDTNAAGSS